MSSLDKELELQKIDEVVDEYKEQGYTVTVQPAPDDLPYFLSGFRPDIVAKNGSDQVVVEVKAQSSLTRSPELQALAEVIQQHPDWRLELVVTNPPREDAFVSLDAPDILKRVSEAKQVLDAGYIDAALLLAWSAAEGALRIIADREKIRLEQDQPAYVVKNLAFLGAIEQQDYRVLWDAMKASNGIAHGFRVDDDIAHLTIKLLNTVKRLVATS